MDIRRQRERERGYTERTITRVVENDKADKKQECSVSWFPSVGRVRAIKPLIDSKRTRMSVSYRLLLERQALPAQNRARGLSRTPDQHPSSPSSSEKMREREQVIFIEVISMIDIRSSSSSSDPVSYPFHR